MTESKPAAETPVIYDITQPLFECEVYPGDPRPERKVICSMENGDLYNLTAVSMCAHNGTHVDAPRHFIKDGDGIDRVDIHKFAGPAWVESFEGNVTATIADAILARAKAVNNGCEKRILIKGKATVTAEAARVFAEAGTFLVGNESQTVGPEDGPMEVHLILLGAGVVLLEGIRLVRVPDGAYFLCCAPLNLTGADGSPCRALLFSC